MFRLKTLSVLAGIVAVLAVSAAPASAWWESTQGQSQGTIHVLSAGAFTIGSGESALSVKCVAGEVKAQYHIQAKGQIKQQQEHTTFGPHLNIQVKNWGTGCKTKVGKGTEELKTEVKECALQLVQQKGSNEATGGVVTACVVTVPGLCELQVPPGMEKAPGSNVGINVGLKTVTLGNVGLNQLDKVNITTGGLEQKGELTGAVYVTVHKLNANCLLPNPAKATLEGLEFEAEGVNAV